MSLLGGCLRLFRDFQRVLGKEDSLYSVGGEIEEEGGHCLVVGEVWGEKLMPRLSLAVCRRVLQP